MIKNKLTAAVVIVAILVAGEVYTRTKTGTKS